MTCFYDCARIQQMHLEICFQVSFLCALFIGNIIYSFRRSLLVHCYVHPHNSYKSMFPPRIIILWWDRQSEMSVEFTLWGVLLSVHAVSQICLLMCCCSSVLYLQHIVDSSASYLSYDLFIYFISYFTFISPSTFMISILFILAVPHNIIQLLHYFPVHVSSQTDICKTLYYYTVSHLYISGFVQDTKKNLITFSK